MFIHVLEAKYQQDYKIWLRFNDGKSGVIDLASELYGTVFAPLKDPHYFQSFQLNPEAHTITWDNGADFAPEFLHEQVVPNHSHS